MPVNESQPRVITHVLLALCVDLRRLSGVPQPPKSDIHLQAKRERSTRAYTALGCCRERSQGQHKRLIWLCRTCGVQ